jgi:hypothetical protein
MLRDMIDWPWHDEPLRGTQTTPWSAPHQDEQKWWVSSRPFTGHVDIIDEWGDEVATISSGESMARHIVEVHNKAIGASLTPIVARLPE